MPASPSLPAAARRALRRTTAQVPALAATLWRHASGHRFALVREQAAAVPAGAAASVRFRCNLCGHANRVGAARIERETPSCSVCGSTVRFRAIGRLVTREVLGTDDLLVDIDPDRSVRGLGLSDAGVYARPLARAFDYRNTYFHRRPRLDVLDIPDVLHGRFQFVIASDVFEHIVPPVARAFANVRKLLAPRGVFIFTAPFTLEGDTLEHFPDLHEWRIEQHDQRRRLSNTTLDGRRQTFDDPVFHGGRGTTLEMRVFTLAALRREFATAGFARIRVADEPCEASGIAWPDTTSVPIVAYA